MVTSFRAQGHDGADGPTVSPLTPAELRVLARLPTHLPLAAVADDLHVSRETVKSHVRSIYRKLGVNDRCGVVEAARRHGLLDEVSSLPTMPAPAAPRRPMPRSSSPTT